MEPSEQSDQLDRVLNTLDQLIIDWFEEREYGHQFHLGEFTRDILNKRLCSPCSPFRVMSHLRKRGIINYRCINRAQSLFETRPLVEEETADAFFSRLEN